jgi:hypothetical protein
MAMETISKAKKPRVCTTAVTFPTTAEFLHDKYPCIYKENVMLESLFWFLAGAFVGWNLPQPQWARDFQARLIELIKSRI